ncbi:MAG: NAD-dependent succinate-semialdehyde dehydrogenase [Pseudomonadota bacterium]
MALNLNSPDLLRTNALVNGAWRSAEKRQDVYDPATEQIIASVPYWGGSEATEAVQAAEAAFPEWRARTAEERANILLAWKGLVLQHKEDLARILTAECGKPMDQSLGEVAYGASFFQWFAEEGKRAYGDVIPAKQHDRRIIVAKEPVGVTAAITPWNFPIACVTRKIAPALAVGCTQVLKPAPETPFTALALAYLGEQAGLPPGVLNVVTGDASAIGEVFTSHPAVRVVTFTGSTAVGKLLAEACGRHVKRAALELGGNAPFIVFGDADVDDAVSEVIASKFRNSGQTCVCANRILVQSDIFDKFTERLCDQVAAMSVGSGEEDGVAIGPLINARAVEKVSAHIEDAVGKGAEVKVGGAPHGRGAYFYQPTVLTGAKNDMLLAREETFGPVAALFRFESDEDAIALANDTPTGLAAYLYTADLSRAFRAAEALQSGMVGVNTGIISTEVAPFGGVKESGIGREGSRYGLDDFLETKAVHVKL